MQVKEENGNYICLKHNQMILLIVLDNQVLPENQMLCSICVSENRVLLNKVLSVQQAKEMIKEKQIQQTAGQEETNIKQLQKLRNLQSNIMELKQQLLLNIETITIILEQCVNELAKSIKNEPIDLIKELPLLQLEQGESRNSVEENIKTYLVKIDSAFNRLLTNEGIQKCYQDFQNIKIDNYEKTQDISQIEQMTPQKSEQSETNQENQTNLLSPISWSLIKEVEQSEKCFAIAFNNSGSIMIAGFGKDIKVWQFQGGEMKQLNVLKGEETFISCLLFSKKNQSFISGDWSGIIQCWQQGNSNSEWLNFKPVYSGHKDTIRCIILNQNEDELISCSKDQSIIVWRVKFETNEIHYHYKLKDKHLSWVDGVSLNSSETALVSCSGDKQIILWIKTAWGTWQYQQSYHKGLYNYLKRIGFVSDSEIFVQQGGQPFTNVIKLQNQELIEEEEMKIQLFGKEEYSDQDLFPPIYNQSKKIIIQKSHEFVYIIRKQPNGKFKIDAPPIQCGSFRNYGNLTEDAQFLVIWTGETNEFRVYKINYE